MGLESLRKEIRKLANSERAENSRRFFKTKKGQYGEGDVFLGLTVPEQRKIAKKYSELNLTDVKKLLESEIHEERLIALLILVEMYKKEKDKIFDFYHENIKQINNWDLVDLSADKIFGNFLFDKDKDLLFKLANSENLWEKRISIVSTFDFIRKNKFDETLKISEILLSDSHDLIHKAVGWMLREVGKRDVKILEGFLKRNYSELPRTTLRYAIEKFDEEKRKKWLRGEI
jgi:3-methyladenine DNA glycosylase AlkD